MKPSIAIRELLSSLGGSLALATLLIFFDVVVFGSYLMAFFVCPIWLLVALVRATRPSAKFAAARILAPVITGLIIFGNARLQNERAAAKADQIIAACNRYRDDSGNYPSKLVDLVPRYLSSIPVAKLCTTLNEFNYYASPEVQPTLSWTDLPPFGRKVYWFESGEWHYVD